MSPLSESDLHRIFERLDLNGDGLVSLEELNWLLEKLGFEFREDELESLIGKQRLDLNEFIFFYESSISSKQKNELSEINNNINIIEDDDDDVESDLVKAFKVFDLDGDGFITSQELECVLKRLGFWDDNNNCKDCRSMICVYDTNSDGRLDFEEFKGMMMLTSTS